MRFTEFEILEELDFSFYGIPGKFYPEAGPRGYRYNFFLDLEKGHFVTAGSRIHLFGDTTRWAVVFETSGYYNRNTTGQIQLNYVGNCINYPVEKHSGNSYISNQYDITLIEPEEFERIENKKGTEFETFEFIGSNTKTIKIRDQSIPFDNNYKNYEKVGISTLDYENPKNLICFDNVIRFIHETNPSLLSATQSEVRCCIPKVLPKLMTINEFNYTSVYNQACPPSKQETFKLIAKVLATQNALNWKPTKKPNNSWKNWDSGSL